MPISVEDEFCPSLSLTNLSNRAGFSEVHCPSTQLGQCTHRSSAPLSSVIGVRVLVVSCLLTRVMFLTNSSL